MTAEWLIMLPHLRLVRVEAQDRIEYRCRITLLKLDSRIRSPCRPVSYVEYLRNRIEMNLGAYKWHHLIVDS